MNKNKKKQFDEFLGKKFFQAKFDNYRTLVLALCIVGTLFSLFYYVTDVSALGKFDIRPLLVRSIAIIYLLPEILFFKKCKSYKILSFLACLNVLIILWCTIGALSFRTTVPHANEGYMVFIILLFIVGLCCPFSYTVASYVIYVFSVLISKIWLPYESIFLLFVIDVPCITGLIILSFVVSKTYQKQFLAEMQLDELMKRDSLTKVFNRNKLQDICVKHEYSELGELSFDCGILVIDIDYFKNVNDTYGHEAGDNILVKTVEAITFCVRRSDYVIRWGGEEFVVILPDANLTGSQKIAENIRKVVNELENEICPITVSIGVSEYKGGDLSIAISNADKALYEAKNAGRNQVIVFK